MKVAVFAAYAINTPHFETELEIIQNHLDGGDEVVLLACNGEMVSCDVNRQHDKCICMKCIGRRAPGLNLLSKDVSVEPFYRLTPEDLTELKDVRVQFDSLEELKRYRIENFDIGYGVLSSLVSFYRDPDIDLDRHADLLRRLLQSAWAVYRSMRRFLLQNPVDRVYVFNGRYAPLRAVFRACQRAEVDCYLHEKGHDLQHYILYENAMPHDLEYVESRIRDSWGNGGEEKEQTGSRWYIERAKGIDRRWVSYVTNQKANVLPLGWNSNQRSIAVLTSSEDEFVAIGDQWKHPLYENQLEGVRRLLNSLESDRHDLHLYIRMHPNLKSVDNRQTRELRELRSPVLTVIPPEATVSSYEMIRTADKVLSFGSTAGIEAVYWGTPSVLAGTCMYRNLGCTYNPATHEELVQLLKANLAPKEKTVALMYGYYFATYGLPFKYYKGISIYEGEFKQTKVRISSTERMRIRLHRIWIRLQTTLASVSGAKDELSLPVKAA